MLFKKEFDIDEEFFEEKNKGPKKRRVALNVFAFFVVVTFCALSYLTLSSNFNLNKLNLGKDEQDLKEAQNYYFDAVKFYEQGDVEKAIEYFNKQISIVEDPDAYSYLAKIYYETSDTDNAISNYKKALNIKPDFFEANFELGKIYFSLNNYKDAATCFNNALSVQGDNIELLTFMAETYKSLSRADDAIALYQKILELEPDNIYMNSKIGEVYFQKLQFNEAIPYFEKSIIQNYDENTALMLAKSYFELGQFDKAKDILNGVLEFNKENKQAVNLKQIIDYKTQSSASIPQTKEDVQPQKQQETSVMNKEVLNNYIQKMETPIKLNWTPPSGSNLKKASVKFTLNKNGELLFNKIYMSSGMEEFDKSALDAIELSQPFEPLPKELNRETLDIIFTFDFNVK